jgi:hypothetical protein
LEEVGNEKRAVGKAERRLGDPARMSLGLDSASALAEGAIMDWYPPACGVFDDPENIFSLGLGLYLTLAGGDIT